MSSVIVKSLNIGAPQPENFHGKEYLTGICKQPQTGPLALTCTGFVGDGVADHRHHGGEGKAVCAYSLEHYAHWQGVLGLTLPPAAFGENLTIAGLVEEDICIGDTFQARQCCGAGQPAPAAVQDAGRPLWSG